MKIIQGDCRKIMAKGSAKAIDAIVTDPPYELKFMGKKWDSSGIAFDPEVWAQAYRVLKPGGYLLAFGGTRTWHRLAVAIEDAGFELRDTIMWLYGSGFPKSQNVSKMFDKKAKGYPQGGPDPTSPNHGKYKTQATEGSRDKGDKGQGYGAGPGRYMMSDGRPARIKTGHEEFVHRTDAHSAGGRSDGWERPWRSDPQAVLESHLEAMPESDLAIQWEGWGTALKPAYEPVLMFRKPLEGTVIDTVEMYDTGAINIEACRIETGDIDKLHKNWDRVQSMAAQEGRNAMGNRLMAIDLSDRKPSGRWPANLILDEEAAAMLDAQSGVSKSGTAVGGKGNAASIYGSKQTKHSAEDQGYGDTGGASRFFYIAKVSARERREGLSTPSNHPTMKPLTLIRYLVRLVTPPGGKILDPFAGSGTTGIAAVLEGFDAVLIELEAEYIPIIKGRVAHAEKNAKKERANS